MKTENEATPRPWYITITQLPDTSIDYHIKDANGNNLKDWITGNLLSFDNETAELIVKAVNAYDSLVKENERLKELMDVEHCPSLETCCAEATKLTELTDENQKLREAFGNCICSIEQYGSLGDSDLEKYKEVLKAKNV